MPAVDIHYGQPPDAALPAGTYELRLDNHGYIDDTLTSDALGVDLRANPGSTDSATVMLPPEGTSSTAAFQDIEKQAWNAPPDRMTPRRTMPQARHARVPPGN